MTAQTSAPNQVADGVGKRIGRFLLERWVFLLLIPCLVTLLALYATRWSWVQTVDNFAIDSYFHVRGAYPPIDVAEKLPSSRNIVLVETSHPVPRHVLVRVLRQLREAKVVAIDLMLVDQEAGLQAVEKKEEWYQRDIARWRQDDALLSQVIYQNGNVVLGAWMEENSINTEPRLIAGKVVLPQLHYHSFWEYPRDELWKSARYRAHLSVEPEDGVVRRVRLLRDAIPSLGLAAVAAYDGVPMPEVSSAEVDGQRYLRLGERAIPLDSEGRLMIDYVGGRESFNYVSNHADYSEVLNFYEPEDFRGKIVVLGENSLSSKDVVSTPFGAMSGMQVHANIIATLLNPEGPLVVWPFWKTAVLTLLCSFLLAALLLFRLPPGANLLLALGEICGLAILGAWFFVEHQEVLSIGAPLLAIVLTYNAEALYDYQRTRRMLSTFIGRDMFRRMLGRYTPLELGGTVTDACAVFCDLRGFSKLAAVLPPVLISRILSEYVNLLAQIVRAHGGRPVSYQGDGVFVLFEETRPGENCTANAVRAALEFQQRFQTLQVKWDKEGVMHLEIGVGIAYGPMMVGLVGAKDHMKPDAIGDPVNVAARLQGLSEETGHTILISENVRDRIREIFPTLYCGSHAVRGRDEPLEVFTVFPPTPEDADTASEKWLDSLKHSYERWQEILNQRQSTAPDESPMKEGSDKTDYFI